MRRSAPRVQWRAVLAGTALALLAATLLALAAQALGAPVLGSAATPLAIALGGFLAGRWAGTAGLLQGGMVGALWIVGEAIAGIGAAAPVADPLADLVLVLASDVVRIALGAAFGWLGASTAQG